MFRIEDHPHGTTHQVFTWQNPRNDGYTGNSVEEGVTLDYDMQAVHSWPEGQQRPDACLGRDPNDPKHYKVFKYRHELDAAGFAFVSGTPFVFGAWSDYAKIRLSPPDPEHTDDEDWYNYLDKADEGSRVHRRLRNSEPDSPASTGRDDVAAWVAETHLITDVGLREIWYLPQGSPPNEIRLLELNDRFAGNEASVEAMNMGLEVEGVSFQLLVADITTDQMDQIKQNSAILPSGWSLEGNRQWRRGA